MRKPLIYKCNGCGVKNFDFDLIIKTTKVYECPNCKIEIKKQDYERFKTNSNKQHSKHDE